jgi:hypothetical protein
MAPYFTGGTVGNLNNFHAFWGYNESTTNAVTHGFFLSDAGTTGWTYGLSMLNATIGTAEIEMSSGETIDNKTNGMFNFTGALRYGTSASYSDRSAFSGTQQGISTFLTSDMSLSSVLRGVEGRVKSTGGDHASGGYLVGGRFHSLQDTGSTAYDQVWGSNSTTEVKVGTAVAVYGAVGDALIDTGTTIGQAYGTFGTLRVNGTVTFNGYPGSSGIFGAFGSSYLSTGVTLSTSQIDGAVGALLNMETGRRKANAAFAAILGNALSESSAGAGAAFKAYIFNTSAPFDYGLDLSLVGMGCTSYGVADVRLSHGDTISNPSSGTISIPSNVGIGTALPVGAQQTKFTATTPIIFATGDTLGSYTSVTFPTANKDYANKTGICTACAVGDLVIITAGTGAYTGQYSVLLKISDNSIQLSRTCHNEAGDIVDGAVSIVGSPALSIGSNRIFAKALLSNASSNETAFRYDYTVNKVAGNSTGLQINATHDLAPGTNYPFQINVGGVEKFSVDSSGIGTFGNYITVNNASISYGGLLMSGTYDAAVGIQRRTSAGTGRVLTLYSSGAKSGETNTAGGNLIARADIGTGNAAGSQFIVQTPTPIGTGTTDQTLVTRTITDVTGQTINYGHLRFISEATPGAPTTAAVTDGGACTDGSHVIATTFVTVNGETQFGAVSAPQTCVLGTTKQTIPVSAIPTGTSGVTTGRNICASKAGTTTPLYQVGASPTIGNNSDTTYPFVTPDGSLTVACNATDGTTARIWVDGTQRIAIDPSGDFKFYDTAGNNRFQVYSDGSWCTNNCVIHGYASGALLVGGVLSLTAKIDTYGGIATVANGIPAIYGTVDLTAQTSAIGATTIYANPATTGQYRVCYFALTKKAGDAVNLALQLTFTTPDDSSTAQSIASANVAINTVGTYTQGCPTIVAKASTNIQYATTLSGGIGAGEYSLWIKVEKL